MFSLAFFMSRWILFLSFLYSLNRSLQFLLKLCKRSSLSRMSFRISEFIHGSVRCLRRTPFIGATLSKIEIRASLNLHQDMLTSWWDDTSSFQLIFDKWEMYEEALYFFNDLILIGLWWLIWPLRVFRVQYIKKWSLRPTGMTLDWEILLVEFELYRIWTIIIVADLSVTRVKLVISCLNQNSCKISEYLLYNEWVLFFFFFFFWRKYWNLLK